MWRLPQPVTDAEFRSGRGGLAESRSVGQPVMPGEREAAGGRSWPEGAPGSLTSQVCEGPCCLSALYRVLVTLSSPGWCLAVPLLGFLDHDPCGIPCLWSARGLGSRSFPGDVLVLQWEGGLAERGVSRPQGPWKAVSCDRGRG